MKKKNKRTKKMEIEFKIVARMIWNSNGEDCVVISGHKNRLSKF